MVLMKKIILPILIITTTLASLPLANAQSLIQKAKAGIESATGAVKEAVGDEKNPSTSAIDSVLEQLKADIAKSMTDFDVASAPDAEKLRKFDNALAETDKVLALTQEGGEMDKLIQKAYDKNKASFEKMRAKANDTSIPADKRAKYEQQLPRYEKAINATNEKRLVLIRMSNDLKKQRENIGQNKEFYLDMLSIKDLEAANESLDSVNSSMDNLIKQLDKLGELDDAPSGPAVQ
jgi:hypothetical protein